MSQPENVLTLIFGDKEKKIPIQSSLKELKQEFIKEFEISSDFPFYLYYKLDTYDIILNEDSFQDFIELNITKIFAEKKIEENIEEENINSECINSEFDLLIKELENEIMKVNKEKENKRNKDGIIIESKECENKKDKINISKNTNLVDEGQIKDLKMKIDLLTQENIQLKKIEKKYKENMLKIEKSKKTKREYKKITEINFQYDKQKSSDLIKKEKEIEYLKNENLKLKNENKQLEENNKIKNEEEKDIKELEEEFNNEKINMQNEIKNLESIIQINETEFKEKETRYKNQKKDLKKKLKELQKQLEEKSKNINSNKETTSKNSSDIDSGNNKSNVMNASKIKKMKRIQRINEIYKRNKIKILSSKSMNKITLKKTKEEEDKYKEKIKFMKLQNKFELNSTGSSDENIMKSMTFN